MNNAADVFVEPPAGVHHVFNQSTCIKSGHPSEARVGDLVYVVDVRDTGSYSVLEEVASIGVITRADYVPHKTEYSYTEGKHFVVNGGYGLDVLVNGKIELYILRSNEGALLSDAGIYLYRNFISA